jgi:hypothetical protein
MFRKNEGHKQQSFFSVQNFLPPKTWEELLNTWAWTFYQEVFCRLDETIFAPLYSEKDSRPNVPVNVLVCLEILKSGFGWSDEELHEQAKYNLQIRLALGLHNLKEEIFTERTIYNFRRRVREYAAETGINLMQKAFEQITDAQLQALCLETGWQRMDSTQLLSNLARMTRLELLVAVLQAVYRGLVETDQGRYGQRWERYLEGRPHQVRFKIRRQDVEEHLLAIGRELAKLEAELAEREGESEVLSLIRRVLEEQYVREAGEPLQLLPGEDVDSQSLQSPHDVDATYRFKGGRSFRGGYVANVSETADPDNPVQLITDLQVEPNHADDSELLEQSLDGQAERGIDIEKVTTDGGYTGPKADEACKKHNAELRATHMRGGTSYSDKWGWEEYAWEVDKEGRPISVTCPQGYQGQVIPGEAEGRLILRFKPEQCGSCPFLGKRCRVRNLKRAGPTIYVKQRMVDVARMRKMLHPEDTPLRVLVESTIRSLKRGFPASKLAVRGLIRTRMTLYPAALMVNLRRLHGYWSEKARQSAQKAVHPLSLRSFSLLRRLSGHIRRFSGMLSSAAAAAPLR